MNLLIHLLNDSYRSCVSALLNPSQYSVVIGENVDIDHQYSHILRVDNHGVCLQANGKEKVMPTQVNFLDKSLQYRLNSSGRSQAIAKAVGLNATYFPTVLDCTAGLGKDAYILASLGCQLTLIERSPVIYSLLKDGFVRGYKSGDRTVTEILDNMSLVHLDANNYLRELSSDMNNAPDVIYLDPMFPARTKRAKVKKDMTMLQHVLGNDEDFEELFTNAMSCAKKRVVVKRPGKRSHEVEQKPSYQIEGKSAHFEIYLR